METKRCSKCKEAKGLEEFNKRIRSADGRQSRCKACEAEHYRENRGTIAELRRTYYQANRDALAERHRENYRASRWAVAEQHRRYRQTHREAIVERRRAYYQKHPETIHAANARRRARVSAATIEPFTPADLRADWEEHDLWGCFFCGGSLTTDDLQEEHFYPLSQRVDWRGPHAVWNLVPAHSWCNQSKGDREPWAFLRTSLAARGVDLDACLAIFEE